MMVEHLKHEGTLHSSSYLLKIFEYGGQLVSTGFKAGWSHTFWSWCFPSFILSEDLAHVIFTYFLVQVWRRGGLLEVLMVVWRGVQGRCGVFFQTYSKTH